MQPCRVNGHGGLKARVGTRVYAVFQGRRRLAPARYPDKSAPMISNRDWEESFIDAKGRIDLRGHAQKRFPDLHDGYYVGMHGAVGSKLLSSWYSVSVPITGLDVEGYILVDAERASSGFMGRFGQGRGLGYIIGARAVLDAPGEWYLDGRDVFLIPPNDDTGHYAFRTRLYGAVITGNGVRLENLRFWAASVRESGDDVCFKKCVFEHISPFQHNPNPADEPQNRNGQSMACGWGTPENGTAGVYVEGKGFVAKDCRFSKSWWCGMMVRGNNARIENCLFEDMDWIARRCAGLFSWGDHNVVRFCTFRNLGGAGLEGGNAYWIGQYARHNIWEYNYIENVCNLLVDQGFFYVNQQSGLNPEAGSIWRYNVGKGAKGPEKGNWTKTVVGYYVDNSSSGYRVHNNIAIDVPEALRYNDTLDGSEAGKNVWFYNNTFYNCQEVGFGCWTPGKKQPEADAGVRLVNNLASPTAIFTVPRWQDQLQWANNFDAQPASVFRNAQAMDFTLTDKKLN